MSVELHITSFGNFFVDGALGGVQVGQAYETDDGSWIVEVNDELLRVTDFKDAIRVFGERYQLTGVAVGPEVFGADEFEPDDGTVIRQIKTLSSH